MQITIQIEELRANERGRYFKVSRTVNDHAVHYYFPVLYAQWLLPQGHTECMATIAVRRNGLQYDSASAVHAEDYAYFDGFANLRGTQETIKEQQSYESRKKYLSIHELGENDSVIITAHGYPINGYQSVETLLLNNVIAAANNTI